MPYIVVGNEVSIDNSGFADREYKYTYPNGLDLRPTSQLHNEILSRLIKFGLESTRLTSHRHDDWQEVDEKLTAYIPVSEKERRVKREDRRKPISIVFPYSYAILETLVSYLMAAFAQEPIFRYEGMAPEDVAGATLLEKVINLHCNRMKVALNLHTMFRDACAYGFGAVSPYWVIRKGLKSVKEDSIYSDTPLRALREVVLFEGNALGNIDPYCFLPDSSVPLHEVQRGEYVGWVDRTTLMDLISDESQSDSSLFNVKYLRHVNNKSTTIFTEDKQSRTKYRGSQYDVRMDRMISDPVDLLHLHVKLIPEQWKLGSSELPEKWLFTVGADSVIIRAEPLGLNHDLFPVALTVPDFDGYSPVAYSRLEVLGGMQGVIDWLFNSHIANVRKAINDVLIVDPHLININDLKNPEAGGLVRLRRPAWGKGVKDAVMQLNIVDITKQNITDVAAIIQYMQIIGGTDNPLMGNLRSGGPERLTSSEFKGTAQGAINRLERIAKIVGLQSLQDIGYMFAYHTQQLMEEDVWLRTTGEWPQEIMEQFNVQNKRVQVHPTDLLVDYDLLIRDGSIPGGNFNEAWLQLFQTIGNSELLLQQFDIVRIFKYIASNLGAKNVDDFEKEPGVQDAPLQMSTLPDEQVASQVQQGNLVPVGA